MFWIFGRKNITKKEAKERAPLSPLYEGDRGLLDLSKDDATLRVYVPTTIDLALKDMMQISDMFANEYLKHFFVTYLYGAHELERMRVNKTGIFYEPPKVKASEVLDFSSDIRFSRSTRNESIEELGKNITQLKIFLPSKMKVDLQALADQANIKLSRFVREILIAHFLGHQVFKGHQFVSNEDEIELSELDE
ncbi:MAG: hypothetical protein WAX04_04900 [Oscillospiraceae bacterium]